MKVIKAGYEILDFLNGEEILKKLERIARVCYKSEGMIGEGTAEKMVRALIKSGHEAMLEHFSFSVKFIVDRGVSHEIVRHRVASFAQESTRYCNYGKSGEVTFIAPCWSKEDLSGEHRIKWDGLYGTSERLVPQSKVDNWWYWHMAIAERDYLKMLEAGATPEQARSVLPNSLKTEVVMTANLREWRHFFKLRAVGTTGKPHPQMREVAIPLLKEVQEKIPVIFEDIALIAEAPKEKTATAPHKQTKSAPHFRDDAMDALMYAMSKAEMLSVKPILVRVPDGIDIEEFIKQITGKAEEKPNLDEMAEILVEHLKRIIGE